MKSVLYGSIALFLATASGSATAQPEAGRVAAAGAPACHVSGRITPICGLQGPEDLELAPDGQHVFVSGTGTPLHLRDAEGLFVLDLRNDSVAKLVPVSAPKAGWGEPACPPPNELSPHGIHLSRRTDSKLQLLVVNHGGRESVEFYEVLPRHGAYTVAWRGCVLSDGPAFNDVAAVGAGFVATVPLAEAPRDLKKALSGIDTGYLAQWLPGKGIQRLPGSEAPFNNGIQLGPDRKSVLFAAWTSSELRKYDLVRKATVAVVKVGFLPDNLTLRTDGSMIAAGITDLPAMLTCAAKRTPFCSAGFATATFDPVSMKWHSLTAEGPGVISGASVALQVGKTLYVGSFDGDRLLKIDLARAPIP